jgi:hypothetical protein
MRRNPLSRVVWGVRWCAQVGGQKSAHVRTRARFRSSCSSSPYGFSNWVLEVLDKTRRRVAAWVQKSTRGWKQSP